MSIRVAQLGQTLT